MCSSFGFATLPYTAVFILKSSRKCKIPISYSKLYLNKITGLLNWILLSSFFSFSFWLHTNNSKCFNSVHPNYGFFWFPLLLLSRIIFDFLAFKIEKTNLWTRLKPSCVTFSYVSSVNDVKDTVAFLPWSVTTSATMCHHSDLILTRRSIYASVYS